MPSDGAYAVGDKGCEKPIEIEEKEHSPSYVRRDLDEGVKTRHTGYSRQATQPETP